MCIYNPPESIIFRERLKTHLVMNTPSFKKLLSPPCFHPLREYFSPDSKLYVSTVSYNIRLRVHRNTYTINPHKDRTYQRIRGRDTKVTYVCFYIAFSSNSASTYSPSPYVQILRILPGMFKIEEESRKDQERGLGDIGTGLGNLFSFGMRKTIL